MNEKWCKTSVGSPIKVSSVSSLSEMSTVQGLVGENRWNYYAVHDVRE